MISRLHIMLALAIISISAGGFVLALRLASMPAAPRPTLGFRGANRAMALQRSCFFSIVEPALRTTAAWFSVLPLGELREALRGRLLRAGEPSGLTEDELLATCASSGVCLGAVGIGLAHFAQLPVVCVLVAAALGTAWPWFRVVSTARVRATRVNRRLPAAIELAAMCMGAGLDFPGSLRRIVECAVDPSEPIIEEFRRILQELDLGHTRKSAMRSFAKRVPTDQVRELVNSVTQAEEKGSPLSSVLSIQAQTQRLRRSVEAEETASGAALMLLGPMTLIFLCVIVLLLGPVVVRFISGGTGSP